MEIVKVIHEDLEIKFKSKKDLYKLLSINWR